MADATAPQHDITSSQPATEPQSTVQATKDSIIATASSTINAVSSSKPVQDLKNGPLGTTVQNEASKTTTEFKDLYGSRTIPDAPAATGQSLTQYHSLFYRLLSWQNPRATLITYLATIITIFSARYLNLLSYVLKFSYFILGITAGLEIVGKVVFDDGLASKIRPRKYWTIPRDSLERSLDDVEQLINFFVIEVQRILYAENVYATVGVFASALVSYWLIKLVPFWGLCLIGTNLLYLAPLIYVKNRETIDGGLEHVGSLVSNQAAQIKNITAEHTGKATESIKSYAGEYSSKAQQYIGSKKTASANGTNGAEFPVVPKEEPNGATTATTSPAHSAPIPAN